MEYNWGWTYNYGVRNNVRADAYIHVKDAPSAAGRTRSDFNGDGAVDVIARRSDGLLFLYPGNGAGGWKSGGIQIGSGWNQFTTIVPGTDV